MEDILHFLFFIGCLLIIWGLWHVTYLYLLRYRYSKVISCLKRQGYRFYGGYSTKGKGLVYRKTIDKEIIDSLLLRYKFSPINLKGNYVVMDYTAIIKFPFWEEWAPGVCMRHGGVRLFHFYSIVMQRGEKLFCRRLNIYLEEKRGQELAPIDLESPKLVESILSESIIYAIKVFNDDELSYWNSELKDWAK